MNDQRLPEPPPCGRATCAGCGRCFVPDPRADVPIEEERGFCHECGALNPAGAESCDVCGAPLA